MNRLTILVGKFNTPRVLWLITVLTMLALALATGAPDAGSCGSGSSC